MEKQRLNIAQVTPGMKLAEPITNASGITLMPAGIRLTPMFIIRLKKWNIDTVEVLLDDTSAPQPEPPKPRRNTGTSHPNLTQEQHEFARSIAIEVSGWFVDVRDNPLMMDLRNAAIKRLVAHGKSGMLNRMRHPPAPEEDQA